MGNVVLFIILVFVGIFGVMLISNRNTTATPQQQISFLPTNTPAPTKPPIPSPTQKASPTPTPKKPTPTVTAEEATQAAILTSKGEIVVDLYKTDAPNTVKNFIDKAKSGFYKNLTFHRVEDWVVQGGDPKGDGTGGGDQKTEFNKKPFVVGSLGVARGGNREISNDAQFFITKKEASWLNEEYTNFGMVKKGMDVVNKMEIGDKILDITLQ